MSKRSLKTIAEDLAGELREARAFQIFARRLGPNDVVYVSLLGWGRDENVVEAKASAMTLEAALEQAILNLNHATATEE